MRSKEFREMDLFLRNRFMSDGIWGFPIVRRQNLDLSDIQLIACSDTSVNDTKNLHKGVHFFVDDYRFENTYRYPEKTLGRYRKYRFLMTPDFSLYAEMKPWRQIESVGKARWVGAYWQEQGCVVIPTVSWAQPSSFRFCFDAIEKHGIVAVGMIGRNHERLGFMRGYQVMLDVLEPKAIICLGVPFPEMEGNIIAVDYLMSRKVMRDGR